MTTVAYAGWVRHRRFAPVEHEFRYPLSMVFLDVGEAALDVVSEQTGRRLGGPVRLLTQPRRLGYSFNPVSFYFCYDGGRVEAVVAEVTNTPWGERHAYVLERSGGELAGRIDKAFHVSPFLAMDGQYEWAVTEPGERLRVHIALGREFDATLSLRRCARHPRLSAGPLGVTARIYLQALRLKLKGAPYHSHPAR